MGLGDDALSSRLRIMTTPRLQERARIIGAALRVAYLVTGSMAGVLDETPIYRDGDKLVLSLPKSREDLAGNRVASRLKQMARVLSLEHEIRIGKASS
jgi:exopolyphosphatase/guanosine-5'-triphosphate,3'-diphosphate pyrophosphatase